MELSWYMGHRVYHGVYGGTMVYMWYIGLTIYISARCSLDLMGHMGFEGSTGPWRTMEFMGSVHGAQEDLCHYTRSMTHNEMSKEDIVYTVADVKHTAYSMLFTVRHCSLLYTA